MTPSTPLRELPAKWRALAQEQQQLSGSPVMSEAECAWHQARTLQAAECADELEAALSARDEAGAVESWKCAMFDRSRAYAQELGFDGIMDALLWIESSRLAPSPASRTPPASGEAGTESDPFKRIPGLHGIADAADYLARNPGDEYATRRVRERLAEFAELHGIATPPASGEAGAGNEIVGHKTLRDESGNLRHEPLTRAEANALWEQVEARDAWRKELMPDEETARQLFFEAWLRLKDFGWREAVYCPKDGTMFDAIEPGSSGVHDCNYIGEWPSGHWWAYWDSDSGPARPALFRLKGDAQ